jgi:hypothetical protein
MSRASVGALAVAILAFAASFSSYEISTQLAADPFRISATQTRFADALNLLPPAATIAYLTDMPVTGNAGTVAYMTARYAVAPRALVPAGKLPAEWAIGNFAHPADFVAIGAQSGFALVRDFGNGVVVYRRR